MVKPTSSTHPESADQAKPRLLKIWRAEVASDLAGQPGQILVADKAGLVVACGTGALRLLEVQPEGGQRMTAREFLSGHPAPRLA